MKKCKITVLKRTINQDLAQEYIAMPVGPCESFTEGQEFVFTPIMDRPQGFCDWAWNDIYKTVISLARGGNFSDGLFQNWMKDSHSMITCCTDGIRPVIFRWKYLTMGLCQRPARKEDNVCVETLSYSCCHLLPE